MQKKEWIIENEVSERLDAFCATGFEEYSREFLKGLIKEGAVLVNGQKSKASYRLKAGDQVQVTIPDPKPWDIKPEEMELDIVYEDEDVLVINKPKGMVVHPAPGNYSNTLVNGLMAHTGALSSINGVMRPGIVHRIDKDTSGLLMVAKNDLAHQSLTSQLKDHSVSRVYYAIVHGVIDVNEGKIDMPIGRHPKNRLKMAVVQDNSKEAITHFEVVKRFEKYTFVRFKLETGRTHQIRVHMEKIGYPLLGDPVYGPSIKKPPFKLTGQCLHAQTLGFIHPRSGQAVIFSARIPEEMRRVLIKLNH